MSCRSPRSSQRLHVPNICSEEHCLRKGVGQQSGAGGAVVRLHAQKEKNVENVMLMMRSSAQPALHDEAFAFFLSFFVPVIQQGHIVSKRVTTWQGGKGGRCTLELPHLNLGPFHRTFFLTAQQART